MVGLRVPDYRHRRAHHHRRRQHVESRAHRHAWPDPLCTGAQGPLHRSAPGGLRARVGWRRRRRFGQEPPHGTHWQLGVPRHLPWRPDLLAIRLLPRRRADADDGAGAAVQACVVRPEGRARQRIALPTRLHLKVRQGAHLQDPSRVAQEQKVGCRSGQPAVRRPRFVVLHRTVPSRAGTAHQPSQELCSAGGLQHGAEQGG
mmetsp:Transcript_13553/g.44255  ORF Transcript_13553/g.44255 Transcript_13553/m.44255 type:complete len:202 (+) Transcript_13553:1756-2361(+)